jgi:uncharacterized protein (TIGR02145 family)
VASSITETDTAKWRQQLTLSGNHLTISSGNTVSLPGDGGRVPVYSSDEISSLTPMEGDAVFNKTEDLYQIYNGNEWKAFSAGCWPQPTAANAGVDQIFTDGTTSATLAAHPPEANHGTGKWTIIRGSGGSFTGDTDPATIFTGIAHEVYTLRWTITTNCDSSNDDVQIAFTENGLGPTLNDIDGNIYNSALIGSQLWMAENLRVTRYQNGDTIPNVTDNPEWGNLSTGARCYYDNDSSTYAGIYGALYNWYTVSDSRNLCPVGWHVPTEAEWGELTDYLGGEAVAGGKLKEAGTTHWASPNYGATNESGFTALPGGYRYYDGMFKLIGLRGQWWSATGYNSGSAWGRNMDYFFSYALRKDYIKHNGFSVRCVKDQ